jgi:hypothetical protein
MKKLLAIVLTICMLASVLCISAFAAPIFGEVVIGVDALLKDGTTEKLEGFADFGEGWDYAIDLAQNEIEMEEKGYERIVVELLADWNAELGSFTNSFWGGGDGFDGGAIFFKNDIKITLNMNGHTINRRITDDIGAGEVMFICENADVVINNGTITGGFRSGEGGGILIYDDANVTLNNVHIVGNRVYNDDGAGIAMSDNATLIMNGGSFKDNMLNTSGKYKCYGGAVFVDGGTAFFNNVEFKDNVATATNSAGAAIYANEGSVFVNECTFVGNGAATGVENTVAARSVVHGVDSDITIKKSTFTGNGSMHYTTISSTNGRSTAVNDFSSLIYLDDSTLTMEGCNFSGNSSCSLFRTESDAKFYISDSQFVGNASNAFYSKDHDEESYFRNCVFSNNKCKEISKYYETISVVNNILTFYDCDLGGAKFAEEDVEYIKYMYSDIPQSEAVMRVSVLLEDGTESSSAYYKKLEFGWNDAMKKAESPDGYDRVVVDLYVDWIPSAADNIEIPEGARVTFNMNGHTINRNMISFDGVYGGEALCICSGADVIINDGKITGGSCSDGAGGIHIKSDARVVLNNVNVVGNHSEGSNGSGIAVRSGSVLVMNGGSISDNIMTEDNYVVYISYPYGVLYACDATVTLNNVTINGNRAGTRNGEGIAIYADDSTVTLNNCVVSNNAHDGNGGYAESIIGAVDSKLIINNTDFTGNGAVSEKWDTDYSHLFYLEDSELTMEGGKITGNKADKLFYFDDSKSDLKGVTITDNESVVFDVDNSSAKVTLTECTLGNNSPVKEDYDVIVDTEGTLVLTNCDLGDTSFEDKSMVAGVGSMFGDGSLAMIFSLMALIASVASILVNVASNKKKAVPLCASPSAGSEDEE